MNKLVTVLFTAAMLWLANAVSELGLLETSSVPLLVAALVHLLLALGVWGLFLAVGSGGSRRGPARGLAAVGALLATAGHLLLIWPPLTIVRSYTPDLSEVLRASSLATGGAVAAAVGTLLLGAAWLASGPRTRWPGVLLIVCPPVTLSLLLDGPLWVVNLAEVGLALALIAVCIEILPSPRRASTVDVPST